VLWFPWTIHFFSFSDAFRNQFAGAADTIGWNSASTKWCRMRPNGSIRAPHRVQVASWSLPGHFVLL
jgi:hypothetical protein